MLLQPDSSKYFFSVLLEDLSVLPGHMALLENTGTLSCIQYRLVILEAEKLLTRALLYLPRSLPTWLKALTHLSYGFVCMDGPQAITKISFVAKTSP